MNPNSLINCITLIVPKTLFCNKLRTEVVKNQIVDTLNLNDPESKEYLFTHSLSVERPNNTPYLTLLKVI